MARTTALLAVLLLGCGGGIREGDPVPGMPVGSTGVEDGSSEEGDDDGTPVGDLPTPPATGIDPDAEQGCEKVDFLFVIDHSGSMMSEQQSLIASFPGFIDAIEQRLPPTTSLHIMVADVDAWVYGACEDECEAAAECEEMSPTGACDCGFSCAMRDLCTVHGDYVCGGATQPMECEDVLGAGVVHPRGGGASNSACDFTSGARYIDDGEPDLAGAFACAAQVGTGSSNPEVPMQAMVEALTGGGAVAECNAGFLREDAILVVTVITDEDDNGPGGDDPVGDSPGTPNDWYDALVAAKGGNADAIVFMGLIGDTNQPGALCTPLDHTTGVGAEDCPRIREFASLFGENGHIASVCAASYDGFFDNAVESIGQACDEFTPEG